ncbi:GNAT family N-acetyltransferase [Streptomyces tubercidicus]|uniref:GNAT family N-acetyltransferase n=1 Tax=Streptomyces tubercidicus TaxID=47759 RepID=UPI0022B7A3AD|nr:GNAT family N-acetyltransferase [Streptomyces tubercidicus]WAU10093.1 GNAT family N-acetyltransferase [Streptomyces tubercidicus]
MNASVILRAPATPALPALVLRPWCLEDVDALVAAYRDPMLGRWARSRPENEAQGVQWIQDQQRGWSVGDRFGFAVLEESPDEAAPRLVGNVILKDVAPGKPTAEAGYWTAGHARGRGVAARALEALTTWAFETFHAEGLEAIELLHQVDNLASCRVAEKCGYTFARTLPAAPPRYPLESHLHLRHGALRSFKSPQG